jgi:hypothetical protein
MTNLESILKTRILLFTEILKRFSLVRSPSMMLLLMILTLIIIIITITITIQTTITTPRKKTKDFHGD